MKIDPKYLSIPPFLATKWEYISSLRLDSPDLIVALTTGESVRIPNLSAAIVQKIFECYQAHEDEEALNSSTPKQTKEPQTIKLGFGTPIEDLGPAMQHNPALSDAPNLPPEMLEKISALSKLFTPEEAIAPQPEGNCNCPFCQIARAINGIEGPSKQILDNQEEEVSEEELRFEEWEIVQSGEKLFNVISKLDAKEKYSVYLGHPVGCTCGKEGCEHILAVLKS